MLIISQIFPKIQDANLSLEENIYIRSVLAASQSLNCFHIESENVLVIFLGSKVGIR